MDTQETLAFLQASTDVKTREKAFRKLCASVEEKDLPLLINAIQSDATDFGLREWLCQPVATLAGPKAIPVLVKALRMNFQEGHDNDGLQGILCDLAEVHPGEVRRELEMLSNGADPSELADIEWLLEFCR